jgi:hypothetical protein
MTTIKWFKSRIVGFFTCRHQPDAWRPTSSSSSLVLKQQEAMSSVDHGEGGVVPTYWRSRYLSAVFKDRGDD